MQDEFDTSSVIVTGASRGIGRVIATTFARETIHPLILISRSEADLEETKTICEQVGASQVVSISCDLTDPNAVADISIPEDFPLPGIIINNAGQYLLKSLAQTNYDEYLNQIKANLFSAVHVVNRFLDDVKTHERGLILNVCSSGALEGLGDSGAYASSKHALLGYTRSLREELMDTEIGVTALNLGQTQSTSWDGSSIDPERLIDPQDVADLFVALTKLSPRSVVEEITMKPQHGRVPPM